MSEISDPNISEELDTLTRDFSEAVAFKEKMDRLFLRLTIFLGLGMVFFLTALVCFIGAVVVGSSNSNYVPFLFIVLGSLAATQLCFWCYGRTRKKMKPLEEEMQKMLSSLEERTHKLLEVVRKRSTIM